MTEAYPLQWPAGRPRNSFRERSRFQCTLGRARDELFRELDLMGAGYCVLSSNLTLRRDGLPYANQPEPDDPGVAVYFEWKGRRMCFACDRWDRVRDNVQAVRHTIGALRGIDRWGTGDMMQAAFSGFEALPPPIAGARPWYDVLGIPPEPDAMRIKIAYKLMAKKHHPDRGGDPAKMAEINAAYTQALEACGA